MSDVYRTYDEIKDRVELSLKQIHKMKHCIGYEHTKSGKYVTYRNYYCSGTNDRDLDYLVFWGLAKMKNENAIGIRGGYVASVYSLTDYGIRMLEEILEISIMEK